jgi:hypothetical protein
MVPNTVTTVRPQSTECNDVNTASHVSEWVDSLRITRLYARHRSQPQSVIEPGMLGNPFVCLELLDVSNGTQRMLQSEIPVVETH